jgi:hypothetical protein
VVPAAISGLLEDDEQRDYGQRRDHQQLAVVDMRFPIRLRCNQRKFRSVDPR